MLWDGICRLSFWGLIALMLAPDCCQARNIQSFTLSDDGQHLTIVLSDKTSFSAPRDGSNNFVPVEQQEGFRDVFVSPNRQLIGWTATFPNLSMSYPVSLSLVIHDGVRVVRTLSNEWGIISSWHFSPDSRSVVYRTEFPHGLSPVEFRRVRIADGKTSAIFSCYPPDPKQQVLKWSHPPKWTRASDLPCAWDASTR